MSKYLISYTVNSNELQSTLNKKMRDVFENKSFCHPLDKTLWYAVKDNTSCVNLCNWVRWEFNNLKKEYNNSEATISISVNEVKNWSMYNNVKVEAWLLLFKK